MSWRPTIIVWIIALIGVAIAVAVYRSEQSTGRAPSGPFPLFDAGFDVEQVSRIELARADEAPLVFEPTAGGWRQVAPFLFPMNTYSVRQLAVEASRLQVSRVLAPGELDEGSLGLDPPLATVTYTLPTGDVVLELGRAGVAGQAYLRARGADDVLVVGRDLHDRAVETNPNEWRDRTLLAEVSVDADRIAITRGAERIVLERDRRQWRMREPADSRVDPVRFDELVQALGRARSAGFVRDQPDSFADYGLDQPVGRVAVTATLREVVGDDVLTTPVTRTLLVGARTGVGATDRYGLVEGYPVVVRLDLPTLEAIFPPAAALADPTASGVNAADVRQVRISGPAGEFDLVRELDRWTVPGAPAQVVDGDKVEELLEVLTNSRAPRVEVRALPAELTVGFVTFFGSGGRPIDTVRIARDEASGEWALENGDGVLRVYPAAFGPELDPAAYGVTK